MVCYAMYYSFFLSLFLSLSLSFMYIMYVNINESHINAYTSGNLVQWKDRAVCNSLYFWRIISQHHCCINYVYLKLIFIRMRARVCKTIEIPCRNYSRFASVARAINTNYSPLRMPVRYTKISRELHDRALTSKMAVPRPIERVSQINTFIEISWDTALFIPRPF